MDGAGRRPWRKAPASADRPDAGRGQAGDRAQPPPSARDARQELWLTSCEVLERREIGRWARAWR